MDGPCLFLSAGDPSGDNAGAGLIAELKKNVPSLRLSGLGGERLKTAGQKQLADHRDLAVLGFWEVAKRFLFFRRLFHSCLDEIKRTRPACVLLIDYPGFNLRLAKKIKQLGIPVVYYITPQVWAWGRKRVKQIAERIDLPIVILPFEKPFFAQHSISTECVGHYLLDEIPAEYISSPIPKDGHLCLMPGSRAQEIERMLSVMLETAELFYSKFGVRSVVAGVKGMYDYDSALARFSSDAVSVVYNDSRRLVYEAQLVLTASGTATLETGIIGRPMVVVYKTGFITYQIARHLVKLDSIALVNLVLGVNLVPELIQSDATAVNILRELQRFQNDSKYLTDTKSMLDTIPGLLHGVGASARAAKLVERYLS